MRQSPAFRALAALLGVLFAINFAQPLMMSGMDMRGMSMDSSPGMSMDSSAHMSMDTHASPTMHEHAAQHAASQLPSAPADEKQECKQHECCASALVHAALAPVATLSWLPEHIISQDAPQSGECVVDNEGQLRLPFANGPPTAVIV